MFCGKLEAHGIQFRTTPRRSPNMNAFAESWVRSVKQECLRKFLIFGQQHLRYLLREYLVYYHEQRPHRGLHNRPPRATGHVEELVRFEPRQIVRRERLGGVLKHYERVAA